MKNLIAALGTCLILAGCMEGPAGPQGERGPAGSPGADAGVTVYSGTLLTSYRTAYYTSGATSYYYWDFTVAKISESTLVEVFVRRDATSAWVTSDFSWSYSATVGGGGIIRILENTDGIRALTGYQVKMIVVE